MAQINVSELRCEYALNPLGIDVSNPRLSWKLVDAKAASGKKTPTAKPGKTNRAAKQKAYQIVVAGQREDLEKDDPRGTLWDSGKVENHQSVHVEYAGKKLKSGQRCWWRVRVWDENGEAGTWSAISFWEMGMLKNEDWHGQWLSRTKETEGADNVRTPYFRKEFRVQGPVRQARVYICGLGTHELRLNGRKVGDHVLDPTFTRFDKRALYVAHDVTAMVKEGANAVGVTLGSGWYNPYDKAVWGFDKAPWRAAPTLRLEMRITLADGREQIVASDEGWKVSTGPLVSDSIYCGETYDARLEQAGWDEPGFDDRRWDKPVVVEGPKGRLAAQVMQPMRGVSEIRPKKMWQSRPGVWVFDAGQNLAGAARLRVKGKAGTQVTLKYAEILLPDGNADVDGNAGLIKRQGFSDRFQEDRYILKGRGVEEWQAKFTYHGFQYVEVSGYPGRPTLDSITVLEIHTDLAETGKFTCANATLNQTWRNTRWSFFSNLPGYPTDCPHREKNGWTGDAHLAAEQAMYNYESMLMYTNWLEDLRDEQLPDGRIPSIIPASGVFGIENSCGPGWDSVCVYIPWYMYLYYGDRRVLERHYAGMKKYLKLLGRQAKKGVLHDGLGDWCPTMFDRCIPVTSTAIYYDLAGIAAHIAGLLGQTKDQQYFQTTAAQVREGFYREFVNVKKGFIGHNQQTDLACALYHGVIKPEDQAKVFANLLKVIAAHAGHISCGILGAKAILNVLMQFGRSDLAVKMISNPEYPGWGYWVKQGATTLWEEWHGGNASRNHIMFGDVSAWFYRALAGICPDPQKPGFEHVIIRPQVVDEMKFAGAEFTSLRGKIASRWERKGQKVTFAITLPINTTATVELPGPQVKVLSGGQVEVVEKKDQATVFTLRAGAYQFESAWAKK